MTLISAEGLKDREKADISRHDIVDCRIFSQLFPGGFNSLAGGSTGDHLYRKVPTGRKNAGKIGGLSGLQNKKNSRFFLPGLFAKIPSKIATLLLPNLKTHDRKIFL